MRHTIIICTFFAIALPSWGQSYEKKVKENKETEQQIASLQTEWKADSAAIARQRQDNEKLKGHVQTLRKEKEALSANVSEEALDKQRQRVQALRQEADSISGVLKQCLADSIETAQKIATGTNDLASSRDNLKDELAQEEAAHNRTLLEKAYADNKKLISCRYSEIDMKQMEQIKADLPKYAGMKGYASYKARVTATWQYKSLYEHGMKAINTPYNYKYVYELRESTTKVYNTKQKRGKVENMTSEQYTEIDSLDIRLSRYQDGIIQLQHIVAAVNNDATVAAMRKSRTPDPSVIARHLSPALNKGLRAVKEKYFSMVPYLAKLFNLYEEQLKSDPCSKTTIEKEILSYKTK